jgi:hypothetical protein
MFQKFDNISKIAEVKKLLKVADNSLLEGILELRGTNKESNIAQGKVYFPDEAYMALKAARELYPELPSIESPTEYKNEADDTGAYYSPLQKYLWDVRKKIAELTTWCDMESLVLLDKETETQITLGTKIDEYNMERRRIVKEGGLF